MEAPTLERLRHAPGYDAPERTQTVSRVAYRVHTPFEAMHNRGDITEAQFGAAKKLTRHYLGAMGVRVGDGYGADNLEGEESAVYHGQMVAQAGKAILSHEYRGLTQLIEETADLESIGRAWLGCKNAPQARTAGKALVISGLERLALYWRLKERAP